ncbi:MAG TPA: dephospho-CoA kinase [Beijerinckiaceae bacterium]|nr:dephospho-CoA kinase [Beijerinckiaceae bacterium]
MLILGLTGSIGMGKSTVADFFRAAGVPVHDSDAAVHALYRGAAVAEIERAFPHTTVDGIVDRARLGQKVLGDADALRRLEAIVHPLVEADRHAFLTASSSASKPLVLLDIPLLFEIGAQASVDAIVVATAPKSVQKARVMARPGMTEEKFAAILAKQLPDSEKRRRAHFLIDTSRTFATVAAQVSGILRAASAMQGHIFHEVRRRHA